MSEFLFCGAGWTVTDHFAILGEIVQMVQIDKHGPTWSETVLTGPNHFQTVQNGANWCLAH